MIMQGDHRRILLPRTLWDEKSRGDLRARARLKNEFLLRVAISLSLAFYLCVKRYGTRVIRKVFAAFRTSFPLPVFETSPSMRIVRVRRRRIVSIRRHGLEKISHDRRRCTGDVGIGTGGASLTFD